MIVSLAMFLGTNIMCHKKCLLKLDLNICYSTDVVNFTNIDCHEANVCHKQFNISYVKLEPYTFEIIVDLLRICCGNCVNVSNVKTLSKLSEILPSAISLSHLVFPVLGRSDVLRLYGYHFIPLVETPNIFYITYKAENLMHQLILSCINMWPLIIICLLLVVISGFIGWIMETWINKEEFPRPFLIGWFEGFWWSFISMTTVGYGDKVPKSVAARLFSIVWIFVGITTFSLVTAMLSSEITEFNTIPPPKMAGSKVGALRHRLYEAVLIAKHGGILIDLEPKNTADGIHNMITMLKNKEIDGFVLDRYTLLVVYRHFEGSLNYKDDVDFLKFKTIQTEVSYTKDQFFYGFLVKNLDDYEFLADFVTDNRDVINTCNGLLINNFTSSAHDGHVTNPLFSTSGDFFWPAFISMSTVIVLICCFGVLPATFRAQRRLSRREAVPVGEARASVVWVSGAWSALALFGLFRAGCS